MSKRVIIADDTAYMRAVIRNTLESAKFNVISESEDGVEGVAAYKQHQPDLMILNLIMPNLGGMDALKQIIEWDPQARIIICSALSQTATISKAIRAGARDFIIKPFEPYQLIAVAQRITGINPLDTDM